MDYSPITMVTRDIGRRATAPVSEALGRIVAASLSIGASEVECPRCGRTLVVLVRATRQLHQVEDGYLGPALGRDHRERVRVTCDACRTSWQTSGRGVARHLHQGRPPLPV